MNSEILLSEIATLAVELNDAYNSLAALSNDSTVTKSSINHAQQRISILKETLEGKRELLNCLLPPAPASVPAALSNAVHVPSALKLPRFEANKGATLDVLSFLSCYEARLSALQVPSTQWSQLLLLTIPDEDTPTIEWVSDTIAMLPWESAKVKLIEHFHSPALERLYLKEFERLSMQASESVPRFADRFKLTVARAGLLKDSTLVRDRFLQCLPKSLALAIAAQAFSVSTLEETIALATGVNAMLALPTYGPSEALSQSHVPKKSSENNKVVRPAQTPIQGLAHCRYCKQNGHLIEACPTRPQRPALFTPPTNRGEVAQHPLSGQTQVRTAALSGISGQSRQPQGPSIARMTNACLLESMEKESATTPTSLITIPIVVGNIPTSALLDTGSEVSIITKKLSELLNLSLADSPSKLVMVSKDSSFEPSGFASKVPVSVGSLDFNQDLFVVSELSIPQQCILGMDAFRRMNLFIGGLSMKATDSLVIDSAVDDHGKEVSISQVEHDELLEHISHSIAENLKTQRDFCNIPEAQVHLDTGNNAPSWVSQYNVPSHLKDAVTTQVTAWLDNGVIKLSPPGCTWNSPLLVVKKAPLQDGTPQLRVCLDPRHINSKLSDDRYPIPILRDLLDSVAGATIFSSLDLKQSYHQFPIHESDQVKTSFTWLGVQYMFQGAPFGLKTLTSIFQRVMSQLFRSFPFVLTFIDDILVFSPNLEQHKHHLSAVIERLTAAMLTLNPQKCKFGYMSLKVLGHTISSSGISVDPIKVEEVKHWPKPSSARDVQSFLGLMNYFRDFIPSYAYLAKPLDELRNSTNVIESWTMIHQASYENLKMALYNAPMLNLPVYTKPFYLATDASAFAIGAVLFQLKSETSSPFEPSNQNIVKFSSRSMHKAETRYSASKREMLAIIFALKKFENYILGQNFCIITDHKPLTYLLSQEHLSALQLTWADTLFKFSFSIIYCPGEDNILPDMLSRLLPDSQQAPVVASIHQVPNEENYEAIAMRYGKSVPCPPERISILADCHTLAHCSVDELYKAVWRKGYIWPNLRKDCEQYVGSCSACLRTTICKQGYHPQTSLLASLPMDHVAIDLVGPLPECTNYVYILVCIDVFTRFIFLRPLKDKSAHSVSAALLEVFSLFGPPKILQSDNGTEFANQVIEALLTSLNTEMRFTTPYHPQGNGIAERAVRATLDMARKCLNGLTADWSTMLPLIQLRLNSRVSAVHGSTPFSLMFARSINPLKNYEDLVAEDFNLSEWSANLSLVQDLIYPAISERAESRTRTINSAWNKSHALKNFPIGSIVMVKNCTPSSKLDIRYLGPFKVVHRTRGGSYRLANSIGDILPRAFPPNLLKLSTADLATDEHYVEKIIEHKTNDGRQLFKVRWLGYPPAYDTWEPLESFSDPALPRNFLASISLS